MSAVSTPTRTALATAAALIGFAANSLLCRQALAPREIDAWSFTAVRIVSGAVMLAILARLARVRGPRVSERSGSWGSAVALYAYAAAFSLAYLRLGAGVGALVLFASVQATMIGWSAWNGVRPSARERGGLAFGLLGLVLLCWPGRTVPDPAGVALMSLAGVAWGAYSLRGRANRAPLRATRDNFVRAVPLALGALALALCFVPLIASPRGALLAGASGALASGLGYSFWYLALPRLSATRASLLQLCVPVLAALGGVALLGERLSLRLVIAGALILGGVGSAVLVRGRARH